MCIRRFFVAPCYMQCLELCLSVIRITKEQAREVAPPMRRVPNSYLALGSPITAGLPTEPEGSDSLEDEMHESRGCGFVDKPAGFVVLML